MIFISKQAVMEETKILLDIATKAIKLFSKHGLLSKGWRFGFDNYRSSFGVCDYDIKTITISRRLCICNYKNNEAILDTILHEIAHALAHIEDPGAPPHGKLWRDIFIKIGGNGKTKVMPEDKVRAPVGMYEYQCPSCHGIIHKDYKSHILACKACCEDYNDGFWDERFICTIIKINKKTSDKKCVSCTGQKNSVSLRIGKYKNKPKLKK